MTSEILVSEIFGPVCQGEGPVIGVPTVFVRTGGCDARCVWCDSLYAVLPKYKDTWVKMSAEQIHQAVAFRTHDKPILVSLSGGNPALHPLEPLIQMGIEEGYTYALETQGSVSKSWFELLSYLVLSPKPPSSGNETTPDCIEECVKAFNPDPDDPERHGALKVVVFNNEDYRYAIEMHNQFPELECYLQVGNDWVGGEDVPEEFQTPRFDSVMTEEDTRRFHLIKKLGWLMEKVIADRVYDVRVLPQLHVLVYGNKRGV